FASPCFFYSLCIFSLCSTSYVIFLVIMLLLPYYVPLIPFYTSSFPNLPCFPHIILFFLFSLLPSHFASPFVFCPSYFIIYSLSHCYGHLTIRKSIFIFLLIYG